MKTSAGLFKDPPPLLFAHRGYSSRAPENTLAAFALARDQGIPGIELDVHLTTDRRLAVFHDDTLKRICGVDRAVEDCSSDELRELSAGEWMDGAFRNEKIPLLPEVFELLGRGMIYDIEIKSRDTRRNELEGLLEAQITAAGLEDRCLISSFNPFRLKFFNPASSVPRGLIYARSPEVPWVLRRGGGRFIAPCPVLKPNYTFINRSYVLWHKKLLGRRLIPWTVDDPGLAKTLLGLGVDGLISNDPGPLKPLFGL
ncbi:MAG: glycerophosphodiester phosphodiesterase [Spirochaetales bacterium]|jgi:glycerophosphoryl diester phosphodiesterase|nr:glycerophosphodiester phosphodiesterase [Spirochaetales bacterium]